jgi:hypothetical protein
VHEQRDDVQDLIDQLNRLDYSSNKRNYFPVFRGQRTAKERVFTRPDSSQLAARCSSEYPNVSKIQEERLPRSDKHV